MIFELDEIKRLRKNLGITQKELAERAGVSQSLVAKIEEGMVDPTFSKAKKVFDVLRTMAHSRRRASDIVNKTVISVAPGDSIRKATEKMKRYNISQMPVIKDREVLGLVDEATILDALMGKKDRNSAVSEIMRDAPPIISGDVSMDTVHQLLRECPIILVADKGKVKGHITKAGILARSFK